MIDSLLVCVTLVSYMWLFNVLIAPVCMECTVIYLEYKEHHVTNNIV